jgi:hypothetical protein
MDGRSNVPSIFGSSINSPPKMADHFYFEGLPTELQLHVLSFTNLVTGTPARDLVPRTSRYVYDGSGFCCGRCESVISNYLCSCHPAVRVKRSSCECSHHSHPLLAVNRGLRALVLDYIYREAIFELGPYMSQDYHALEGAIRDVDSARLASVRILHVLVDVDSDDMIMNEMLNYLLHSEVLDLEGLCRRVLEDLRAYCTRPDVIIRMIFISYDIQWSTFWTIRQVVERMAE